jgi:hypothetical protein
MFIEEGSFKKAYEILEDGGLPEEMIRQFFLGELRFEGDTRADGSLSVVPDEGEVKPDFFYYSVQAALGGHRLYELEDCIRSNANENISILFSKVLTSGWFFSKYWEKILRYEGYPVIEGDSLKRIENGVILQNGKIVTCGWQEHRDLYPILCDLKLSSSPDWIHDELTIHITGSQLSGSLINKLRYTRFDKGAELTPKQIRTLFAQRDQFSMYGYEDGTIPYNLYKRCRDLEDHGGKYAGLMFLSTYYPHISLPKFSKEIFDTDNNKIFLRTSPKESMPGLLHSKLLDAETLEKRKHDSFHAKVRMEIDFKKFNAELYKITKRENKLHVFYQEYIEGPNGVCSYIGTSEFNWSMSIEQGAVVGGKMGDAVLSNEQYDKLRKIASTLYKDLDHPIQLEFVIGPDDDVYIVQLRLLYNNFEKAVIGQRPEETFAHGLTFSKGTGEFEIGDVLVVDSEAEPEQLLGKKALLVREDVEFSHALALSKVMRIPSIYGIGKVDLPDRFKITAYNKEGFVSRI